MHRRDHDRLCEWAQLVGADLPEAFSCDSPSGAAEDGQSASRRVTAGVRREAPRPSRSHRRERAVTNECRHLRLPGMDDRADGHENGNRDGDGLN